MSGAIKVLEGGTVTSPQGFLAGATYVGLKTYAEDKLDLGLLLLGGLIFWELRSRDQLVVGGLFKDVQINEVLLLAPVLFLTVVGLLFIRFFQHPLHADGRTQWTIPTFQ